MLITSIDEARDAGRLRSNPASLEQPGFRRRLAARFSHWARRGKPLRAREDIFALRPSDHDALQIFNYYQVNLAALEAVDVDGLATHAARAAATPALETIAGSDRIAIVEPLELLDHAGVRLFFDAALARDGAVDVALPCDREPTLAEAYAQTLTICDDLIMRGFEEIRVDEPERRPAGLRAVADELFRLDRPLRGAVSNCAGLRIAHRPAGDGAATLVLDAVRDAIAAGVDPSDVLVLVPKWDDDADRIVELLLECGIHAGSSRTSRRRLARDHAVDALVRAVALPTRDWRTRDLVRLLNHGRVRPRTLATDDRWSLAMTASALRRLNAKRGRRAILSELRTLASDDSSTGGTARLAGAALPIVEDVIACVSDASSCERVWRDQIAAARAIADCLGLDSDVNASDALGALWRALEDHAATLDEARSKRLPIAWNEFAHALAALADEIEAPARAPSGAAVRVEVCADAFGSSARRLIVANLAEGSFPTRRELERDDDFHAAMFAFSRTVGVGAERVLLVAPNRDENGVEMLASGFVDDLEAMFDAPTRATLNATADARESKSAHRARSPNERRASAFTSALKGDLDELRLLARNPEDRAIFASVADALRVNHDRTRADFGIHDGRLRDPAVLAELARDFGPDAALSDTLIEEYLACPFRFFARKVLGLAPIEEAGEFDDDRSRIGSRVHALLREIEELRLAANSSALDPVAITIENFMSVEITDDDPASIALDHVEKARVRHLINRYIAQSREYFSGGPNVPTPVAFELSFGSRSRATLPPLRIGAGPRSILIQGRIDRVDRFDDGGFRVIDYKTGASPTMVSVQRLEHLQLPLYSLAYASSVEDGAEPGTPRDVGYWSLKGKGFKAVKIDDWEKVFSGVESRVLDVVDAIRTGEFDVDPAADECEQTCPYAMICRIKHVRAAEKQAPAGRVRGGTS